MEKRKCAKCGASINERYTYCRDCFYKMGSPTGTVVNNKHKCRKCGCTITGRYNYCIRCAKVLFADNLRWQK